MLIGITHTKDLQPIIREPRVLKVSIGIPKGRAVSIYIYRSEWILRYGVIENNKPVMKTVYRCKTRAEAEAYHAAHKLEAAVFNRPQKLPFFTFSKRSLQETEGKPVEVFEPDFAAIEAHGETPRELDVVIMSDNPYHGEYQMWSATELKCHGDGVNALRVVTMGNEKFPHWADAKSAGDKFWPLGPSAADEKGNYVPCWTEGCEYAKESVVNGRPQPAMCKPGVTLNFQLANDMRLGATAYFHTTSIRSSWQIFSGLQVISNMAKALGAPIVGLPLRMVLTPFRSNHNGQAATQYGVSLELRASDMKTLRARIQESAWTPRQIAAPKTEEVEPVEILTEASAPAVSAEWYPEQPDEDEGGEPEAEKPPQQVQTESKTSALAEKLNAKASGVKPSGATVVSMPAKPEVKSEEKPPATGGTQDLF